MEKEKVKKYIDKILAIFAFIFFSIFLTVLIMLTEAGKMINNKIGEVSFYELFNHHGILFSIILVLIYILPFIFTLFIIFEILKKYLSSNFKIVVLVVIAMCIFLGYVTKNNDLFYYFFIFLLILMLFWLFIKLISSSKKRIKYSIISILLLLIISLLLPIIFPKINYKYENIKIDIYKQRDCNNHKEICLKSINPSCELISSTCFGFSPCGRPLTWDCGKGFVGCNYICPKNNANE